MNDILSRYFKHIEKSSSVYRIRTMAGIIVVELICIALMHLWPAPAPPKPFTASSQGPVVTHLKAPVATAQNGAPPPPSPQVPIPVPNNQPIKQKVKINLHKYFSNSTDTLSTAPPGSAGNGNTIVGNPNVAPQVTRIVEPTYENHSNQKYEIIVKFLVNKKGMVEKAKVTAIYELDKNGNRKKKLSNISPQIKEAVIKASYKWRFNPAMSHGKPVRAYTKNYFTI
jgi:hypothetical protein